ncbi:MAG: MBL fold metallo-hydrolase [Rhodospirillales bacterium]|jgi:hypothetical protein|nr:MBL fold metallo-hydrolase [Rhodospirillales bacterium]MDP6646524.1 MBL fold metallo-hydrolase [Rhodospirillales bacterium]MDP6840165.1 MBL fold metallo-hydrolase [Rhodospirillales bacterium]
MRLITTLAIAALALGAWLPLSPPADAQSIKSKPHPCGLSLVNHRLTWPAALNIPDVAKGRARVIYLGHSTYQIETPGGARAATDFNGFNVLPGRLPQIVTMNNSHNTHYADIVDPAIKYVLRGWDPGGGIARHHIKHLDLRVYNLPTNIFGASNGNSVFVFEAAGLCFAHLGHLHHALSKQQVAQLGRIDVLFVPIDGTVTLSHEEAFHIIGQIRPRLIMPMHFGFGGPAQFVEAAGRMFTIKRHQEPYIDLARADLPVKTEVLFLGAGY